MENLKITLEMNTAIEMPKFPISLDGLLYWAIVENGGDPEMLDQVLGKKDGIYQSSTMRFVRAPHLGFNAESIAHPTCINWVDYNIKTDKKVISMKGGPYRKRVTEREGILAQQIEFSAVGDRAKIEYLLSIQRFIGLNNKQGSGEISNISITPEEHDYSWFDEDGELARILPVEYVDDASKYLQCIAAFKPNYKTTERKPCCLPNFRQTFIAV